MPAFLHFFPGLTPESYYRLTIREQQAMAHYMIQVAEASRG